MKRFSYIILLSLFALLLSSCNKNADEQKKNVQTDSSYDESDTTSLTPQEALSATLLEDIMNQTDDDLAAYIQDEIYPIVSKSQRVTMERLSASLYLLQYESGGSDKYLLIQKFYSPATDEVTFTRTETSLTPQKQFLK
jgi:PBP1b-binding outer membrane lipoprotein LpoB